jgi:hypothetical protein
MLFGLRREGSSADASLALSFEISQWPAMRRRSFGSKSLARHPAEAILDGRLDDVAGLAKGNLRS